MIAFAVCAALALLAVAFSYERPRQGVLVCAFLAPWSGLDVDLGLRVTAYQLALAGCICGVVVRGGRQGRQRATAVPLPMWLYLAYSVGITLAMIPFLPDLDVVGGAMRSQYLRPIAQMAVTALVMSPLLLIPRIMSGWADVVAIGRAYVAGCVVLAVIGLAQITLWYTSGVDPLPMGYVNSLLTGGEENTLRSGQFEWDGFMVYRMSSFGGEPKGLGQSLVVGLMVVLAGLLGGGSGAGRKEMRIGVLLLVSIFLTQSTSAFALLAVGIIVGGVLMLSSGSKMRSAAKRRLFQSSVLAVAAVATVLLFVDPERISAVGERAESLLRLRTVDRESYVEDSDETVMAFLLDQPRYAVFGTGLGTTHLFAMPYLPTSYARHMQDTTLPMKSGWLKLVAETGILGLTLFLLGAYSCTRGRPRGSGEGGRTKTILSLCVAVIVTCYLLRTYVSYQLFIVLGCALAGDRYAQRSNRDTASDQQHRVKWGCASS